MIYVRWMVDASWPLLNFFLVRIEYENKWNKADEYQSIGQKYISSPKLLKDVGVTFKSTLTISNISVDRNWIGMVFFLVGDQEMSVK